MNYWINLFKENKKGQTLVSVILTVLVVLVLVSIFVSISITYSNQNNAITNRNKLLSSTKSTLEKILENKDLFFSQNVNNDAIKNILGETIVIDSDNDPKIFSFKNDNEYYNVTCNLLDVPNGDPVIDYALNTGNALQLKLNNSSNTINMNLRDFSNLLFRVYYLDAGVQRYIDFAIVNTDNIETDSIESSTPIFLMTSTGISFNTPIVNSNIPVSFQTQANTYPNIGSVISHISPSTYKYPFQINFQSLRSILGGGIDLQSFIVYNVGIDLSLDFNTDGIISPVQKITCEGKFAESVNDNTANSVTQLSAFIMETESLSRYNNFGLGVGAVIDDTGNEGFLLKYIECPPNDNTCQSTYKLEP